MYRSAVNLSCLFLLVFTIDVSSSHRVLNMKDSEKTWQQICEICKELVMATSVTRRELPCFGQTWDIDFLKTCTIASGDVLVRLQPLVSDQVWNELNGLKLHYEAVDIEHQELKDRSGYIFVKKGKGIDPMYGVSIG